MVKEPGVGWNAIVRGDPNVGAPGRRVALAFGEEALDQSGHSRL
jgi:hypothetical protein